MGGAFVMQKKTLTQEKIKDNLPVMSEIDTKILDEHSENGSSSEYDSSSEEDYFSESEDDYHGEEEEKIQEYSLVQMLGKGGFGVVWEAIKDNKHFALKIGRVNDEKNKYETNREIEAMKKLSSETHKNVIQMIEEFEHEVNVKTKHTIIVFPLYQQDLERYIRDCEGMSLREVQDIFPKLLQGLSFIHRHGMVHTDLKPNNILINLDSEKQNIKDIVIGDFGCASWDTSICKYGKTSCYRSVNIILNESATPEDDIWSCGCILFEMLTNQYLFDPDVTSESNSSYDLENSDKLHLMLMLEVLGPFPKKLALKHRKYFNAKGCLKGNPRPARLDIGTIFQNESELSENKIPIVSRLILSMLKYWKRQRATITEILEDPFFN